MGVGFGIVISSILVTFLGELGFHWDDMDWCCVISNFSCSNFYIHSNEIFAAFIFSKIQIIRIILVF